MAIHSAFALHGIVAGAMFVPLKQPRTDEDLGHPHEEHQHEDGKTKLCDRNTWTKRMQIGILKDKLFVIFIVGSALSHFGFYGAYGHLANRAIWNGMEKVKAAGLVSLVSLSALCSRLLTSVMSNLPCTNRVVFFIALDIVAGTGICLCPIGKSFSLNAAFVVVFGIGLGESVLTLGDLFEGPDGYFLLDHPGHKVALKGHF